MVPDSRSGLDVLIELAPPPSAALDVDGARRLLLDIELLNELDTKRRSSMC